MFWCGQRVCGMWIRLPVVRVCVCLWERGREVSVRGERMQ